MRLHNLAEACEQLERTDSRRAKVEIVASLLAKAKRDELESVVRLLQAELRPPYEGVETGLGEQLLVDAIVTASGASRAVIERQYRKAGDLGLVAQAYAPAKPAREPTVHTAYTELLAIAHVSGSGSVARKVALMAKLLRRARGSSAKLVTRVAQGRLRLGLGDETLLEAAAVAALKDRALKSLLEHAYNVRSDLAGVIHLAFVRGKRGLEVLGPQPGIPVRPALAQRLASADAIIDRLGSVQAEPKYDGIRLQLHRDGRRVWIFSRRLENVTDMFPELVHAASRQLRITRAILEGEAIGLDAKTGRFLPFQETMTRKRKAGDGKATRAALRLFAFDLLEAGRANYLTQPQRIRSRRLREIIRSRSGDPIVVTESRVIERAADLSTYFNTMIKRGLEGVLAKQPDAPYRAGARGYDWVKLKKAYQSKLRDTVDVVLIGYLRGRGKRARLGIGSLLGAVYDPAHERFRSVAKIGSGLSDSAWQTLRKQLDRQARASKPTNVDSIIVPDVWVTPTIVVEVLADEITRSPLHTCGRVGKQPGYALRFPRVLTVRTDKAPRDATSEKEILDLFGLQRGARATKRSRSTS